jgi:hypothetical protein
MAQLPRARATPTHAAEARSRLWAGLVLVPAAVGLLRPLGCNDYDGGAASGVIATADCDEVTLCAGLDGGGGAAAFNSNPTVLTLCQGEPFVALCGDDAAAACASAITSMPVGQCGLFANGYLPVSCQGCVGDFKGLPNADDAGDAD